MVKTHHTPPRFLQEKLTSKKFSFVKKHISAFLKKTKQKNKGELPSNPQLLCQYIDYLGRLDNAFKGIDHSCIVTTYEGIYQIYDPLRRAAGRDLDEKPATSKPASPGRLTRAKEKATPASKATDQIEENDPPVKVTSHGPVGMGDEKKVLYRKQEPSSASISPENTVTENSHSSSEAASEVIIGGPFWQQEKALFCKLLDSFDPTELRELTFKVNRDDKGIMQMIVENMRAQH